VDVKVLEKCAWIHETSFGHLSITELTNSYPEYSTLVSQKSTDEKDPEAFPFQFHFHTLIPTAFNFIVPYPRFLFLT